MEYADLLAAQGEVESAAQRYREALELDPHQRRATVAQGEALKDGLLSTEARIFDATQFYLARSEHPWIGFEEFYDYVHFTPYGAALLAEGLFLDLARAGWLEGADPASAQNYAASHRNAVLARTRQTETPDFFEPERFLGIGLNAEHLTSRNLWKYEAMALELDEALQANPKHMAAYLYRGNRRSFRQGEREAARADWKKALELGGPADVLEPALQALASRPRPKSEPVSKP